MKETKLLSTCILLLVFRTLSAQIDIDPSVLWPGRISAYPSYDYTAAVISFSLEKPEEALQGTYWYNERAGYMQQVTISLPGQESVEQRYWSHAADGQVQGLRTIRHDTLDFRYQYNPAGRLIKLTEERSGANYDYTYQPDTRPLRQLATGLEHWPMFGTAEDTVLVAHQQTGDRYWLLIQAQGSLSAYIHQSAQGALEAHYQYNDQSGKTGGWTSRLCWNVLTDRAYRTHRTTVREEEDGTAVEHLATGQWYGAFGQGPRVYLHANGHALWQEQENTAIVGATWERTGGKLKLQLDNRRAPYEWEEQRKAGALWLLSLDDHVLPMLTLNTITYEMQQATIGLERFSWEAFTSGNRVGLQHRLDGRRLAAKYDAIDAVAQGFAIVNLEGLQGVLGYDGQALTPIYYESLRPVEENVLLAKKNGHYGLIRPDGERIIAPRYAKLYYEGGQLRVAYQGRMGVIDTTGQVLIPIEYDSLSPAFGLNQRFAWSDGQMGILTADKWFLPPGAYEQIVPLNVFYYLIQYQSGLWAIWQTGNGLLTEVAYPYMSPLGPRVLLVQQNGRFGLLKTDGSVLTPIQYQKLKGCNAQSTPEFCSLLAEHDAVAQFISPRGFGYLDAYGREHPPRLPSAERLKEDYQTVRVNDGQLELTFPKAKWRWESSANRLYKQGDYGRVRVFYEWIELGGLSAEDWLEKNLPAPLAQSLKEETIGGQSAWVAVEEQRIRYYDFRKKYAYIPLSGGQLLKLEFSCKTANYLENAQDLYEIEQLLKVNP